MWLARERQQLFRTTCIALDPGEARFRDATIKVTRDDLIHEASPEAKLFLEAIFP